MVPRRARGSHPRTPPHAGQSLAQKSVHRAMRRRGSRGRLALFAPIAAPAWERACPRRPQERACPRRPQERACPRRKIWTDMLRGGGSGRDGFGERATAPLHGPLFQPGEQRSDVAQHGRSARRTVLWKAGERAPQQRVEARVRAGRRRGHESGVFGAPEDLQIGVAAREAHACRRLEQDRSEGVEVGARVDVGAGDLLGREVGGLPADDASLRARRPEARPRDAEVRELDVAFAVHEHVVRADVAVDREEERAVLPGGGVQVDERAEDVAGDGEHGLQGQTATLQHLLETGTVHALQHEERRAPLLAVVQDLHDVRIAEPRAEGRLVGESGSAVRRPGEVREEHLHDDALAAGRLGLEDLAHPAHGDATEDPVRAPAPAAERVSRRRGHVSASSDNRSGG